MSSISMRIGVILSIGLMLLAGACTDARKSSAIFDSKTGKHPDSWVADHPAAYRSDMDQCKQCHGSDLKGGISGVSCSSASFNGMSCHGHPAGWNDPTQHGTAAKAAPSSSAGFSSCELCHGADFSGGFAQQSCFTCHGVNAPHASAPWVASVTSTMTHTTTNQGNATVCGYCHEGESSNGNHPYTTPTGPVTCFDNTLCHGQMGHTVVGWPNADVHGAAAKSAPNATAMQGFSTCQACHGANFAGGTATTCFTCHGVSAPHAFPWQSTSTRKHSTTDVANAPACGLCHLGDPLIPVYAPLPPGANPGCFNTTLCHGPAGDCVSCHRSSQNGRRVVTGLSGDFVKTYHHVTNGTTAEIVNKDACAICHGDLVTDLNHPLGALPAIPNVQLMDPDTTGVYVATTAAGVEQVCAACHDGTGATRLGGNALSPFSVASDITAPSNIGWTATQQAHSVSGAYGGCLACHGNAGTANAHGSGQYKMMRFTYDTTIAAYLATNAGNFCYNCHGTTVANGATSNIQTQFGKTRKHSSEKCSDCHSAHQAKAGNHTAQTNAAGGVLNGATGAAFTTYPGFWIAPTAGNFTQKTIVSGTDPEATLCFKCHTVYSGTYNTTSPSGSYAMTDVAREFNPNNVGSYAGAWASGETAGSFHPVLAAATNNLGRTNNIIAPWTTSSFMTCSDCHASDTITDPNGPHGSAANFILKGPNTAWNATIASLSNNAWMPAGTFCLNCHANNDGNGRFPEHSRGDHSIACSKCHIMIPHGSEHPGLLHSAAGRGAGVPAPTAVNSAPYMRAATGDRLYINSYPANNTTNWTRGNCGCNGSGH